MGRVTESNTPKRHRPVNGELRNGKPQKRQRPNTINRSQGSIQKNTQSNEI